MSGTAKWGIIMAVKGIYYILAYVSDLGRSKQFYKDKLGWELGTDEYGVAGFSFGTGYLVLHEDPRPVGARPYPGGMHVEVMVDDARAEHARLKALGVPVSDVKDQPWGERNFSFTDPDGYQWSCGQDVSGR
jgi:catechol 2,3-dioxygenase-like lactoylglutathione lyase family enzyme